MSVLTVKGSTLDYNAPDEEKERALEEKVGMLMTEAFFVVSRANRFHTIPDVERATLDYLHRLMERCK